MAGARRIDPNHEPGLRVVVQKRIERLPCDRLVAFGDGVFQVDDDGIGRAGQGLGDALRAGGRNEQNGAQGIRTHNGSIK